ncbi:MAG: tRNA (N6-isopentenyl adenosine(37)-C2)-methylthiotransferase MiaB [Thermotogae bacterium]|nr:tRNA (N6-isopentenyl adenosine(37)-C2)-methylthiotransferase MiaB [Thermotogota bacterium]
MKIFFKTYGCQMNVHDTEVMKGLLVNSGHTIVTELKTADLVVINTCAVRGKSENKVYSLIGRLKKGGYKVGITGCVAQAMSNKLKNYDVEFIIGTRAITSIIKAVEGTKKIDLEDHICEVNATTPALRRQKKHAWVNIIAGCDKFCTYCIVPYTRGRELSRPLEDIVDEVKSLASQGYNQVTFLGQNVDSYGKDMDNTSLAKLLEISQRIEGIERFWFLTSYPSDVTTKLIDTVAKYPKLSKNFHIPAQSGSNRILKKMNRRYSRSEYLELVNEIRSKVEGSTIGGDIIVGFPTETDEDFEETLSLVKAARYIRLNVAPYSPRFGTVASKFYPDDVPYEVKKIRIAKLASLQHDIEKSLNEKSVGQEVEIMIEGNSAGRSYGRTIDNRMVFVNDKIPEGEILKVRLTAFKSGTLYGQIRKVSVFAK